MSLNAICEESERLAAKLNEILNLTLFDNSKRIRVSGVACSMSLEHWSAVRVLFGSGLLPSGLVVHRAQFEALMRSVWLLYAASEDSISKLSSDLNLESEQATKNLPQVAEILQDLATKAPPPAYDALLRFKTNSWKALNSYAHAGIHPLRRHEEGYPLHLLKDALRNANGLAVLSCMQAVVLAGRQPLQRRLLDIAAQHPNCMPPPL